jgi:ATP-dependent Zn protease
MGGMEAANDPHHTATHEAGHAVIARVLTLACGGATIVPNYDDSSAGHSITADQWTCLNEWQKRGKVRDSPDAVWHARIIAFMAGAEAEQVLLGATQGGDGDDRDQIELMAEELDSDPDEWVRLEARLRAMTRTLVRRHRALIERVASALLERKTLSREELDGLIGRSVDDVKVNAPFLLMMFKDEDDDDEA